ncbi:E3 ubiquitin-protein ligase rnf168-like [Macrobrachium nipponense]|uniref:E3 ubiquitin-protein ligase rnf168-like n=1 Tax=Macrobrachium nipponense TaxID=159736 RepID=UPI0030C8A781
MDCKTCGICNEVFNEDDRCPRILPCTHCLCSICLSELIERNSKTCPFCRVEFTASSSKHVGINIHLLEVLRYVSDLETTNTSLLEKTPMFCEMSPDLLKKVNKKLTKELLSSCQSMTDQIHNVIQHVSKFKSDLSEVNEDYKHSAQAEIHETTSKNELEIKYLIDENERLETELASIVEQKKQIQELDSMLEEAVDYATIGLLADKVNGLKNTIKNSQERIQGFLSEWDGKLPDIDKVSFGVKKGSSFNVYNTGNLEHLQCYRPFSFVITL